MSISTRVGLPTALLAVALAACGSNDMTDPNAARLRPSENASLATAVASKVFLNAVSGVDKDGWSVTVGQKAKFEALMYDASGKVLTVSSQLKPIFKSTNPKIFPIDSLTGGVKAGFLAAAREQQFVETYGQVTDADPGRVPDRVDDGGR